MSPAQAEQPSGPMTMEVIMTCAVRPSDFHSGVVTARSAVRVPRPGFLTRLFDALVDSRARQAERDVGVYLARRGFKLTDSVEREMNERLFNGGWNSRR